MEGLKRADSVIQLQQTQSVTEPLLRLKQLRSALFSGIRSRFGPSAVSPHRLLLFTGKTFMCRGKHFHFHPIRVQTVTTLMRGSARSCCFSYLCNLVRADGELINLIAVLFSLQLESEMEEECKRRWKSANEGGRV